MISNITALGIQLMLLSNLTNMTAGENESFKTVLFRLSRDCQSQYIRLNDYSRIDLTSNSWSQEESPVEADVACTVHVMTTSPDQGICIKNNGLHFRQPGIEVKFFTTTLGPEKVLRRKYHRFQKWCTQESTVSIELSTSVALDDQDHAFRFTFALTNVSKEEIAKTYYMDSFRHCDLSYTLEPGNEVQIAAQRNPVISTLPTSCMLTIHSSSRDEYGELCVKVKTYSVENNCLSKLDVSGFNPRFWPATEMFGCNNSRSFMTSKEACSLGKSLTFNLTRGNDTYTGFHFEAVVKSKWHPYWNLLSKEFEYEQGLGFMKGLTYFIATIDSLAGILVAALATMIRNPRWFWKDWVESMENGSKCEPVHYEASYSEGASAPVEEILTEKQAY